MGFWLLILPEFWDKALCSLSRSLCTSLPWMSVVRCCSGGCRVVFVRRGWGCPWMIPASSSQHTQGTAEPLSHSGGSSVILCMRNGRTPNREGRKEWKQCKTAEETLKSDERGEELLCGRVVIPSHQRKTWSREGFPETLQPVKQLTVKLRKGVRRWECQRKMSKYRQQSALPHFLLAEGTEGNLQR